MTGPGTAHGSGLGGDHRVGVVDWLLAGDPAIRWQVERDLLGAEPAVWQATRARVPDEGWAAELLSHRDPDGTWAGGLYGPKWTGTFYTLQLLVHLGVTGDHEPTLASLRLLLDRGVTDDGGVRLWSGPSTDDCVTGMLLTMAVDLGKADDDRIDAMARWLLERSLDDGGWNCQRGRSGATHSSFHTTISVLEGLTAARPSDPRVAAATSQARQFLLAHRLYRSHTTGEVARADFARPTFPTYWYYDILRALDHFRVAGAPWDPALQGPADVVRSKRKADGRWLTGRAISGREWLRMEPSRSPSRWMTLRARRVLDWVEAAKMGSS